MRRKGEVNFETRRKQIDYLYAKYKGICQNCNKPIPRRLATREHVQKLREGGPSTLDNLTLFCSECNLKTGRVEWLPEVISDQIARTIQRQATGLSIVANGPRDAARVCRTWSEIIRIGIEGTIRRQQLSHAPIVGRPLGDIMLSSLTTKKSGKDYGGQAW